MSPPNSIPWYHSAVLRGILIAAFTQILARVAAHFHLTPDALAAYGINADACAQWVLDALSAAALAYATHGRVTKPNPAVTLTKGAADVKNDQPPEKVS